MFRHQLEIERERGMGVKRILVIDDERGILDLMKEYLDELGIEAILAEGGKQGLSMAKSENPDVILLDLLMQDMPGNDVAQALRENPETANIPIIFLSSLIEKEDMEKRSKGNHKYLSKNLIWPEFVKELKKLLPS